MECADGLFRAAGLRPADLGLVACMKGPGSFTGLRIGFSAAKGMALALGIPLAAVPTLDCLAYPLSIWPGIVIPAMDAKQGCFFTAFYRNGRRLTDYMDASPQTIANTLTKLKVSPDEKVVLTGGGAALLCSSLAAYGSPEYTCIDPESRRGRARELLEIIKNSTVDWKNDSSLGPVYLRKSDAELKSR